MNGRADVSTSGTTDSEIIDHENMNMIRIDQIGTPSIVSDAIMDLKTRASTCPIENNKLEWGDVYLGTQMRQHLWITNTSKTSEVRVKITPLSDELIVDLSGHSEEIPVNFIHYYNAIINANANAEIFEIPKDFFDF